MQTTVDFIWFASVTRKHVKLFSSLFKLVLEYSLIFGICFRLMNEPFSLFQTIRLVISIKIPLFGQEITAFQDGDRKSTIHIYCQRINASAFILHKLHHVS